MKLFPGTRCSDQTPFLKILRLAYYLYKKNQSLSHDLRINPELFAEDEDADREINCQTFFRSSMWRNTSLHKNSPLEFDLTPRRCKERKHINPRFYSGLKVLEVFLRNFRLSFEEFDPCSNPPFGVSSWILIYRSVYPNAWSADNHLRTGEEIISTEK